MRRKRVVQPMRELGIAGVTCRRYKTRNDSGARPALDLVNRDFSAEVPDQLWGADITQVLTWAGGLYLSGVLDAWIWRVIGWVVAPRMPNDLIGDALTMEISIRWPRGPVERHPEVRHAQAARRKLERHRSRSLPLRPASERVLGILEQLVDEMRAVPVTVGKERRSVPANVRSVSA